MGSPFSIFQGRGGVTFQIWDKMACIFVKLDYSVGIRQLSYVINQEMYGRCRRRRRRRRPHLKRKKRLNNYLQILKRWKNSAAEEIK